MARKKTRQTFEKMKREQAVKEKRARKEERRAAARLAKTSDGVVAEPAGDDGDDGADGETGA
jgi:hypothetical protein